MNSILSSLLPQTPRNVFYLSYRFANTKPWSTGPVHRWNSPLKKGIPDYTYRWARSRKTAKIELPNFEDMRLKPGEQLTPDRMRSIMKEKGIVPHRSWDEKPIILNSSGDIIDPYKPPAEEAITAGVVVRKSKELAIKTFKKVYQRPISKIRDYLGDFDPVVFAGSEATDIYIKAHETLAKLSSATDMEYDEDSMLKYVTEAALPNMMFRSENKTIRWKFIQSLEDPKVVHAVTLPGLHPGIVFAQITVRMHSQQMLAIYDRFGRLIFGSENALKDVLEYVVFENYLSNKYGVWRLHGKIIPDQMIKDRSPPVQTMKLVN